MNDRTYFSIFFACVMKSSEKTHARKRSNENWTVAVPSCDASPLIWLPSVPWPLGRSQLSWRRISVPKPRMAQQWMPLKRGPHLRNAQDGYELRLRMTKKQYETRTTRNDPHNSQLFEALCEHEFDGVLGIGPITGYDWCGAHYVSAKHGDCFKTFHNTT